MLHKIKEIYKAREILTFIMMSHMALGFTIFMLSREYKIIVLAFFTK